MFIKWSNTLKQFRGEYPLNCLSSFDHFVDIVHYRVKYQRWRCLNNNTSFLVYDSREYVTL